VQLGFATEQLSTINSLTPHFPSKGGENKDRFMSDKEAYELLVKYSNEKSLIQQREMLRQIGIENTMNMIIEAYGVPLSEDFKNWMFQALTYLNKEMLKPTN